MRKLANNAVRIASAVAIGMTALGSDAPTAAARDFLSSFFDTLSGRPQSSDAPALGFGSTGETRFPPQAPAPTQVIGRTTAYCVRTCDGRYFPISAPNEQGRIATCNSLCPASETKVYYGSSIDAATNGAGRPYSALANAFKYREQLVSGCTCNGKDTVGLASISVDADKTLRRGDIVSGENGLIVANRSVDRRSGKAADFSPAPQRIREKFERAHAMARN